MDPPQTRASLVECLDDPRVELLPASRRRSRPRASSQVRARRYGRSLVIASSASATAKTRAPSGISVSPSPSGYPQPSQRSWWWRTIRSPWPWSRATPLSSCSPSTVCVSSSRRSAPVQRALLEQDLVRDPDLAHVVEQESVLDAFVFEKRRLEPAGELDRVALHALRVRAGAGVLRFERARKSASRSPGRRVG